LSQFHGQKAAQKKTRQKWGGADAKLLLHWEKKLRDAQNGPWGLGKKAAVRVTKGKLDQKTNYRWGEGGCLGGTRGKKVLSTNKDTLKCDPTQQGGELGMAARGGLQRFRKSGDGSRRRGAKRLSTALGAAGRCPLHQEEGRKKRKGWTGPPKKGTWFREKKKSLPQTNVNNFGGVPDRESGGGPPPGF